MHCAEWVGNAHDDESFVGKCNMFSNIRETMPKFQLCAVAVDVAVA